MRRVALSTAPRKSVTTEGVEAPAWQGAFPQEYPGSFEEAQRRQAGCIGGRMAPNLWGAVLRSLVLLLATTGLVVAFPPGCGGEGGAGGAGRDVFVFDPTLDLSDPAPADAGPFDVPVVPDLPPSPDLRDDDTSDPDAPELADVPEVACPGQQETLAEARWWLEASQPFQALELYREAEAACPESIEARFGAALAQLVDVTELVFSLVSMGGSMGKESQDDYLAGLVHDEVFAKLAERLRGALLRLDALADEQAPVAFPVERLVVYNVTQPFLAYRGEFDRGDVQLMRSVAQTALFLVDVLRTQDLRAPILELVMQVRQSGFDGVRTVLEAVGGLLAYSPETFGVHPEDGAAAYAEAAEMLAGLSESLDAALDFMRDEAIREPAGSEPQVSTLRPGATAGVEQLVLSAGAVVGDDGEIGSRELVFYLPDGLPTGLRAIRESVRSAGTLVAWEDGPRWLLAAIAAVVLKLDIVGEIDIGGIPLRPDRVTIDIIAQLLGELLPLPIACDFGTMFGTPAGLRDFLPTPTSDGRSLVMEWECPAELADDGLPDGAGQILCAQGGEDAGHFLGSPHETAPDGLVSVFPYFAFTDPTLHGLVHVDLQALGLSGEPGYSLADQTSLNAALATGIAPILDLVGR